MNLPTSLVLSILAASAILAHAETRTWKAATTGDWFEAANWAEGAVPAAGDSVVITNRGSLVLLTNSTDQLAELAIGGISAAISNAIVFTNWGTTLGADAIEIRNYGILTLPLVFTNDVTSNNIVLVCTNLSIAPLGKIDADLKGYPSGDWMGYGPGGGTNFGNIDYYDVGGAGHGGYGGRWQKTGLHGLPYGDATNPVAPGSGSETAASGRAGGGAVRIHAASQVLVNGSILANGGSPGAYGAGASGGSIWITCRTFAGTNGVVSANGGNAHPVNSGGGGSGGRISIQYDPDAQSNRPPCLVRISAAGGTGARIFAYGAPGNNQPPAIGNPDGYGDPGTLFFPDLQMLRSPLVHAGRLITENNASAWAVDSLWVSNGWFQFPRGFTLTVSGDLLSSGSSARLVLPESTLTVGGNVLLNGGAIDFNAGDATGLALRIGGNVLLTNSAKLLVRGGITNDATPDWGVLVEVGGGMAVATNCVVFPWSNPTNGGSPLFRVRELDVHRFGSFNANYLGFLRGLGTNGFGPGGGKYLYGAGGYGGVGGKAVAPFSQPYGDSNAPVHPGSGGAGEGGFDKIYIGEDGGGVIRVEAAKRIRLDGTLTANGGFAPAYGAGGAGGSIYLKTREWTGEGGTLMATGGYAYINGYGGGGGGRIAVWRMIDAYAGAPSNNVYGGTGAGATGTGTVGTVVYGLIPFPNPGVLMMVR